MRTISAPYVYTPEQFEHAQTHDDLWNATQHELLLRGKIHGYYRMYPWGERPILGRLRYMSLEGIRRKTDTAAYIREVAELNQMLLQ